MRHVLRRRCLTILRPIGGRPVLRRVGRCLGPIPRSFLAGHPQACSSPAPGRDARAVRPHSLRRSSDGLPRRLSNTFRVKDSAILRSASDVRSALFKTTITSCTWRPTSSTSVSSSPAIGGSAPTTTSAASMWGINAWVAAVLPANTEPSPGVSTKHMPVARRGLGTKTSTPATPLAFSGLCSSETNCCNSSGLTSSQFPPRNRTRALLVLQPDDCRDGGNGNHTSGQD